MGPSPASAAAIRRAGAQGTRQAISFALEFAHNPNNPANNGDCASGADHNQSRSNDRPFDTTPTQQSRQAAGNSHYRHSMLLRHRPAELLRSSGRDTQCPHVCREKCEHSAEPACDRCPIYPHRGVARSHKYERICKSIRQFIENLSRFRLVATFDGNHSVEKIAQKAQLDQQGRNQEKTTPENCQGSCPSKRGKDRLRQRKRTGNRNRVGPNPKTPQPSRNTRRPSCVARPDWTSRCLCPTHQTSVIFPIRSCPSRVGPNAPSGPVDLRAA